MFFRKACLRGALSKLFLSTFIVFSTGGELIHRALHYRYGPEHNSSSLFEAFTDLPPEDIQPATSKSAIFSESHCGIGKLLMRLAQNPTLHNPAHLKLSILPQTQALRFISRDPSENDSLSPKSARGPPA